MSVVSRLDAFQRRHVVLGYPLAVVYKFFDDQGVYLAAIITIYAFLSLFPLLLLLSTVLGYTLESDPDLQQRIIESALGQFPVIKDSLRDTGRLGGGTVGLTVGIVGSLYGSLGVGLALQNAVNIAWSIPRNERPNPVKARLRSLLLIATAGIFVIGTTVISTVGADLAGWLGASTGLAQALTSGWVFRTAVVVLNVLGFAAAFHFAAAYRPRLRTILPGAIGAGVVWQALQNYGAGLVSGVISRASATNAVFAVVIGLIAFLLIASIAIVLCIEADIVRVRRLYPRALLTPFTDQVDLTEADKRAYAGMVRAQGLKGFQQVSVTFEKDVAMRETTPEAAARTAPAPARPAPARRDR